MNICMSGLDYSLAPIALRAQLSFTKNAVMDMDQAICAADGVRGAVLLSTCNRTELYLSLDDGVQADPGELLCRAAGLSYEPFASAFLTRRGEACARHLMAVACGLESQILGEDQILTQVKTAALLARQAGCGEAALETLFRLAAACGKAAKSGGRLTGVATSAAHRAVEAARERLGDLAGKRALVIGNGEMGRLAASLLVEAGCDTTVTLRSYHHGETVVPAGCAVVPYDDRFLAMDGMDLVLSATTSPHYTIYTQPFQAVKNPPSLLIDLAIPRDIQPETGDLPGVALLNVDDLGRAVVGADAKALARVEAVMDEHLERFRQWSIYRESLPALEELKAVLRVRIGAYLEEDMEPEETAELTIDKVVDLLAGGMTEGFTSDAISACAAKIRSHTRA